MGSSGLKGIKPAEDENLHLYQISPDELDRYVRVQDEILGWHEHRLSPRQLVSLTVLPAGCIKADTQHQGRLSAFWLSMDGGDSFTPLERQIDPLQLAANAGETETVQSC